MKQMHVLPDEVLLEIFDFYVDTMWIRYSDEDERGVDTWQSLVQVCRQWRSLVLGSPHRLNLQLHCRPKTPARDTLDIWPALPLVISGDRPSGMDNVIAALGQSNRVLQVNLRRLADWQLKNVLATMQVPFPELTELQLSSNDVMPLVIPDSFLDGSAPRLRLFELSGIPFLGLPKLLLSATHLVDLYLHHIPHSGYISPEVMVALLSLLSSLRRFCLEFRSPQSRPDLESRSLPPSERSILPALFLFDFKGVTKCLEELVTRIDTPQLDDMRATFFNQINLDCPRLTQFINCTPTLWARDRASVEFGNSSTSIALEHPSPAHGQFTNLEIAISWREPDRQLSSVIQVFNSSFLCPLSTGTVKFLTIERRYMEQGSQIEAIENTQWLQLLLPFTAVKVLYISKEFATGIAAALQGLVGSRIAEVLPSLQKIIVEWPRYVLSDFEKNIIALFIIIRNPKKKSCMHVFVPTS
jgi:F-box-like